ARALRVQRRVIDLDASGREELQRLVEAAEREHAAVGAVLAREAGPVALERLEVEPRPADPRHGVQELRGLGRVAHAAARVEPPEERGHIEAVLALAIAGGAAGA